MKMIDNFPNVDMGKIEKIYKIKDDFNKGLISKSEAKELLKEYRKLEAYEIALIEQEIKQFDKDECVKENIQEMLDIFEDILVKRTYNLEENHSINIYLKENKMFKELLEKIREKLNSKYIKNEWLEIYENLIKFEIHLIRKQNQLYPILENKGFDRPSKTMWVLDDYVRDEIKKAYKFLKEDNELEFISLQKTIIEDVFDLISKEETILFDVSLKLITKEEFENMKIGDDEIGYAIEQKIDKRVQNFGNDIFNLSHGSLTLEQINLIFKNLPIDVSYVDENDIVKFYNDTEHRIFPRSRNVIGRNVVNCHPPKSYAMVEEIIDKFRSGEQNVATFWINKDGVFIYMYYVAVRDENGKFRGILEMMQDCTRIRSLEGTRSVLVWDNEKVNEVKEEINSKVVENIELNEDTRLQDLLSLYPKLKDDLPKISINFKMLKTPLSRVLIPKANIKIMSERSGVSMDILIEKIKEFITEYEKEKND